MKIMPNEYEKYRKQSTNVIPKDEYDVARQSRVASVVGPEVYVQRETGTKGVRFSIDTLVEMKRILNENRSGMTTVNMFNPQTNSVQAVRLRDIVGRLLDGITNDTERIAQVYKYAVSVMEFQNDPPNMELVKSPQAVFNDIIRTQQRAKGDCDDFATLIATFFAIAGMKTGFLAVANQPGNPQAELDHVLAVCYNRDVKQWEPVDPVAGARDWSNHRHMWDLV